MERIGSAKIVILVHKIATIQLSSGWTNSQSCVPGWVRRFEKHLELYMQYKMKISQLVLYCTLQDGGTDK